MPVYYDNVEDCVEAVIKTVGSHIRLGLPLGLGKPNQWVNALYQRVKEDSSIKLDIYTALSLELPDAKNSLEKRFLSPFYERIFGGYQTLDYLTDMRRNQLPAHINVYEFFVKSGSFLKHDYVQQHYLNCNYTHVPRDLMAYDLNVVAQAIAFNEKQEKKYSFSSNPEISLELQEWIQQKKANGEPMCIVGQTHEDLPYMPNDAAIDEDGFDFIINNRNYDTRLFAPPDMPVTKNDYLIGLYASTLIKDGGTLQIGIGSLSDAIVYACKIRHENNNVYQEIIRTLKIKEKFGEIVKTFGDTDTFSSGLYGCSEMFVDGFLDLIDANILTRKVYPDTELQIAINQLEQQQTEQKKSTPIIPGVDLLKILISLGKVNNRLNQAELDWLIHYGIFKRTVSLSNNSTTDNNNKKESILIDGNVLADNDLSDENTMLAIENNCFSATLQHGIVMHGGFFLGPESFYNALREMPAEELEKINMTGICYINSLYGEQSLKAAQRQHARFFNTTFTVNLLGAATSDGLHNGQMVSGVGGQYNFVAQGNELKGARSILLLRATRTKKGKVTSNVVWNYGHTTIPRHLRDIYITEYGIADLRGKSDAEVIKSMLNIADSRFQSDLMQQAKDAGKLEADYEIPELYKNNLPTADRNQLKAFRAKGFLPRFPFGCDFSDEELRLGQALKWLAQRSDNKIELAKLISQSFLDKGEDFKLYLQRMDLEEPQSFSEKIERALVLSSLKATYT